MTKSTKKTPAKAKTVSKGKTPAETPAEVKTGTEGKTPAETPAEVKTGTEGKTPAETPAEVKTGTEAKTKGTTVKDICVLRLDNDFHYCSHEECESAKETLGKHYHWKLVKMVGSVSEAQKLIESLRK
jgi:hypothetical protein